MNARPQRIVIVTLLMIALILTLAAGCGPSSPKPPKNALSAITVYVDPSDPVAQVPVQLAVDLGFFRDHRLNIILDRQPHGADIRVAPIGPRWPIVGYITVRPDLLLVAPTSDPHFRLRALDHLPMPASTNIRTQTPLADAILRAHDAVLSHWSMLPMQTITSLWRRHQLPWVLVTLPQAAHLLAIDPHTMILAWLGASSGPIPSWVVSAPTASPALIDRFLAALDLALWYLNTTPAWQITSVLRVNHHAVSAWMIKRALQYGYWPATIFPTSSAYNRRRINWNPTWPEYDEAVDTRPASQALGEVVIQRQA